MTKEFKVTSHKLIEEFHGIYTYEISFNQPLKGNINAIEEGLNKTNYEKEIPIIVKTSDLR
ncbi:MAG: hypothetical protein HRU26_12205 [Psychroserpens sp.]|nr:hypothetical protein [Psychroserpens sp.]